MVSNHAESFTAQKIWLHHSFTAKKKNVICPYFVNPEWFKCGSNLIHKKYSDSCLGEWRFMCDSCEGKFGQVTGGQMQGLECQGKAFELCPLGNGEPWRALKQVSETVKESFRRMNLAVMR